MGSQAPATTKSVMVENSTDYSKFQIMGGNRKVDLNHVKKLEREMEYDPDMLMAAPILVNENFYIIDGQHRFHAARNLNAPVYYIVKPGANVEAARHLNTTQKRWTLIDFAHSYAEGGRMDYVKFLRYRTQFSALTPTIVMLVLAGNRTRGEEEFRRGEFRIRDEETAIEELNRIEEVQRLSKQRLSLPMARALLKVFNEDNEFDFGKFMQKLERASDEFQMHTTVRNCLRSLEDVYNFQSSRRVRLY